MLASCTPFSCLNIPWKACKLREQKVHKDVSVQNRSLDQVQSHVHAVINEERILAWQNGVEHPLLAKMPQRKLF